MAGVLPVSVDEEAAADAGDARANGPGRHSAEDGPDGPSPIDRRSFVKGALLGAAAGAAGAAGLVGTGWLLGRPEGAADPAEVTYAGARALVGSPTDVPVPIVPLRIDGAGYVQGVPNDLRPYGYCQRTSAWPGYDPDLQTDDVLRYALPPERRAHVADEEEARERWWFLDRLGERIHVDDFRDRPNGTGAMFTWRTEGTPGHGTFYGVLLKIPRDEIEAADGATGHLAAALPSGHDLVAFDAACTHFCCVAGWKEDPSAELLGFWDMIFCTCHNARFDPRQVETYTFRILPDGRRQALE